MNLPKKKLKEIEELAELLYSLKKIAIIAELNYAELQRDYSNEESPVYKSYMKGFLRTDVALRTSLVDLAKRSSTPAQEMVMKLIYEANTENLEA